MKVLDRTLYTCYLSNGTITKESVAEKHDGDGIDESPFKCITTQILKNLHKLHSHGYRNNFMLI